LMFYVSGRGGHGGGAIEIIAANDIVIGTYGAISVRGEDGQQSSGGGGGGGGSGGTILLAAGGTVVNQGVLDVSGGNGGFGGQGDDYLSDSRGSGIGNVNYGGGGGGGGRIAMYAESCVNTGQIRVAGGMCGALRLAVNTSVAVVSVQLSLVDDIYGVSLDDVRLAVIAEEMINATVAPLFVDYLAVNRTIILGAPNAFGVYDRSTNSNDANSTYVAIVTLEVTVGADLRILNESLSRTMNSSLVGVSDSVVRLEAALRASLGQLSVGGVSLIDVHINPALVNYTYISPIVVIPTRCTNNGLDGSSFSETTMTTSMYVRTTSAAEGTGKALFFSNREITNTSSGATREAPFSWNGPILPFEPSQPQVIM
jgi:hypothetical protein